LEKYYKGLTFKNEKTNFTILFAYVHETVFFDFNDGFREVH